MAEKNRFRWRTNPGVIAQYYLDRHVKHGEKVVLKPNEACVVIENGNVIGISTQTKMEVNPKVGILSKIFGKGQPNRAFMFILLGPHDLLLLISGRTSDGHEISGLVSLKVEFITQDTTLLLQFPAKGQVTIGIDNLVEILSPEVNSLVNTEIISPNTLEEIKSDSNLQEDLKAILRANLSKTLRSLGLQFLNCYANWNQTEFENLISMQNEVDNLRKHKTIIDEEAQIEMEATLSKRKRELDLLHQIHVQDITVEAQRNFAAEIAEINAQKNIDDARWNTLKSQQTNEKELIQQLEEMDRKFALKASQDKIELAKNETEELQIRHEQELSMRRDNLILDSKAEDEKVKRAMSMFEQVQENKRKRMELKANLNSERQAQADEIQAEMMRLAAENNALDSDVMKEFLKQQTEQKLADGKGSEIMKNQPEEKTIFSPDGKFMWDGNEWISVPHSNVEESKKNAIKMQDSIVKGDIVHNTIINNDTTTVTSAVINALHELGMIGENAQFSQPPASKEIKLPQSFNIGDHVEYHSPTNAMWLDRCTVTNVNEDGTYRINVLKDGGITENKFAVVIGTAPGTIRPARPPFSIGERVLVNWKNYGTYYPGKIFLEHDNHTFLIHFDDGDIEDNVEWGRIEKLEEEIEDIKKYVEEISEAEQELINAFQVFDYENNGTISAKQYFKVLTEMGDNPVSVEDVRNQFNELGIELDSEINYRELVKFLINAENQKNEIQQKTEVVIKDALIDEKTFSEPILRGHAYAHPILDEGPVKTSQILNITYDENATARIETRNTIYVVGPRGWKVRPNSHPLNNNFQVEQDVKVEWRGSWWDATIIEINDERYLIHYIGFDTSWDEWVTSERIQIRQ
ncbi:MAG: hypothetical protein CMB56_000825 [Methanobacteriota archaeon]|mgnify:CR=1 FL=1|nr:MAG: hypothetical protein CMB56_000825 [Euryarchaeota archaeon]